MNVEEIEFSGFFSHANSRLVFPKSGIVLITGPNGAGKSAIVEAPSYAFWGKTLRGTPPWKDGRAGQVRVTADIGTASRKVTAKGTKSAAWVPAAGTAAAHDTSTKASDAIARVAGDMEAWRRCHVFSSRDGSNFTEATDAARKELLEGLLGLDCFDKAWERCRNDLRQAEHTLATYASIVSAASSRKASAEASLRAIDAQALEPEPAQPATGPFDQAAYDQAVVAEATFQGELRAAQSQRLAAMKPNGLAEAQQILGELSAELRAAQRHLQAVSAGACSACQQSIAASHYDDAVARAELAQREYDAQKAKLDALVAAGKQAEEMAAKVVKAAEDRLDAARTTKIQLGQAKTAHDAWTKLHAAWDGRMQARAQQVQTLEDQLTAAEEELFDAQIEQRGAEIQVLELKAVSEVLGLKGVRSTVLGAALGGIEQVTNLYLGQISQRPTAIKLRSYTESASGTVQDKISLEVIGDVGGGYGYKASSGGERRRIDASLVLALAEMNAASSGRTPGTVWMDEVFDALDEAGVEAVCGVLEELAQDRVVVVISHSETVINRLPAVMKVRVEDGQLV